LYLRNCAPCHGDEGHGDGPNAEIFLSKPRDLREGFLAKYPTDDLVRRMLDGRALSLALDVTALRRQAKEVGAIDAHIRRFPTLDWMKVEKGWAIYADRCAVCHGPFGRPQGDLPEGVKAPRDLGSEEFQKSLDDEALLSAVQHGRKGMPALVPRLQGQEAENGVAFVRLLGPGFESYTKFCGHCHGDDGIGIGNFDPSVGAPEVTFDRDYFARVDPVRFRESIWHMLAKQKPSMPHFRKQISEAEAGAIIEYLRSLPAE
jgi:mono/diheme cytochrome c family protein